MLDKDLPMWAVIIIWSVTLIVERAIGRAKWTPAASILDLIGRAFKHLFSKKPPLDQKLITGHFIEGHYTGDDMALLEGKELEGKIGDVGGYSLDINEHLVLKADLSLSIDLLAELKKVADKSSNSIVKGAYNVLAGFLGETKTPPTTPAV